MRLLPIAFLCLGFSLRAATVNATSCSQAHVDAAVGTANDGDTVVVPACGSTTWTNSVTVSNKALDIQFAGIDVSTISLSGGTDFINFDGTSASGNVGKISGVTVTGTGNANGYINITSSYRFRLHHLKLTTTSHRDIYVEGSYGLIDHIQVIKSDGSNAVQVLGGGSTPTGRWLSTIDWGSSNWVFIEDSTFTSTDCNTGLGWIDGFNGSKIVFRHNTATNQQGYVHGYDTASESALATELSNNLFQMHAVPCPIDRFYFHRGGAGYFWNNVMDLTESYNQYAPRMLVLAYFRSDISQQGSLCNGSGPLDGNTGSPPGYPCWQQTGMGGGATGGRDSAPIYEYNNSGTGNYAGRTIVGVESDHIVEDRDYFLNTPMPGFTPYAYPHPLQGSSSSPTVTTTAATSIGTTTASSGGNVTSDGGDAVTVRGVCYGLSANPTTPCTSDGTGAGSYSSSLTGLSPATTYHYRAVAINGVGTSYGSDLTFTTSGTAQPINLTGKFSFSGKVQ